MTAPSPDGSPFEPLLDAVRVEWAPSTLEVIEVRVSGRLRGPAAAGEPVELLVAGDDDPGGAAPPLRFRALVAQAQAAGGWSARFAVPGQLRARLAAGLRLRVGPGDMALPPATPAPAEGVGAPPPATVVEPAVLAGLRARREGQADEGLVRRALAAEATVVTLETQLAHVETRLRDALAERDRIAVRLTAAEQDAESERRMRADVEGERDAARIEGGRRVAELHGRMLEAEQHAAALAAEMDEIRREGAEAQQAAAAARAAAERVLRGRQADAPAPPAVGPQPALAPAAALESGVREAERSRVELEHARAELAAARMAREDRDAALRDAERTIAALRAEAAELRRRLDDERARRIEAEVLLRSGGGPQERAAEAAAEVERRLAGRIEAAGRGFAEQLAAVEQRLGQLREELEAERVARVEAEAELVEARERVAAAESEPEPPAEAPAPPDLDATGRLLAAAQEQLARERARSEEASALRAQAGELVRQLEAAGMRLKEREPAAAPADEPADTAAGGGQAPAEPGGAAAAAGTGGRAPAEPGGAPAAAGTGGQARAEPGGVPAAAGTGGQAPAEPGGVPATAGTGGRAPAEPGGAPAATGEQAEPERRPLLPVVAPAQRRPTTNWLTPALVRLARADEDAAARLLLALLAAQGGLVRRSLTYLLTVRGHGSHLVSVGPTRATVESAWSAGGDVGVDARAAGSVAALAPLAGGGATRRLPDVRIEGRRRRLRRLIRARRAPVDLGDVASRWILLPAGPVIAVLAVAVDPAWTIGRSFSVVYEVEGDEPLEVVARDGAGLAVRPPSGEPPDATVAVPVAALLPLLTGAVAPGDEQALVAGDERAVQTLHRWFARVQGLEG